MTTPLTGTRNPKCGTSSGRAAHYARGEKVCDVCAEDHRSYERFFRANRGQLKVPSIGARRRVQGLMYIGHPAVDIAAWAGMYDTGVRRLARGDWDLILVETHNRIDRVFRERQFEPGRSANATARAKASGWFSVLAWDDDVIDDPAAHPNLTGYEESVVRALIEGQLPSYRPVDMQEAVRRLLDTFKPTEIARLMGVDYNDVKYYAYRRAA